MDVPRSKTIYDLLSELPNYPALAVLRVVTASCPGNLRNYSRENVSLSMIFMSGESKKDTPVLWSMEHKTKDEVSKMKNV